MVGDKLAGLSKDAVIYGLGDALGKMIGLILLPILTRIFGPADYGAIDILTISYMFLLVLVRFGVPSGVQRYYYRNDDESRRVLVSSSYAFMTILALLFSAAIVFIARPMSTWIEGDSEAVRASIVMLALTIPVELSWNYLVLLLRLRRRPVAFSLANTARIVVTPTLTVLFVVAMEQGIVGVFRAKFITMATITGVLFFFTRREFCSQIEFRAFRQVVLFALPGHPGLLLKSVMNVLPRYMLAFYAPIAAVGLFGIAMRISSVMKIYVDAFNRAWNPFAYANEGAQDERRIYEVAFRGFALSLVVVVMGLCLFAPELLKLLTTEKYVVASSLVPGIAFHLAVDGLVLMFSTLLYTRNQVRWTSYLGGVKLIVFFASAVVLAPRFGAPGVVGALVISSLVYGSAYAIVTLKVFHFSIPVVRFAVLLTVTAAATAGLNQWEASVGVALLSKAGTIVAASWIGLLLLFSPAERVRARQLVGNALDRSSRDSSQSDPD